MVGKNNDPSPAFPPNLAEVLRRSAIDLAHQGNWKDAITINEQIISHSKPLVDDFNRLGKCYMECNRFGEAFLAYQNALNIDPENIIASKNCKKIKEIYPAAGNPISPKANSNSAAPQQLTEETLESRFEINDRVKIKVTGVVGIVTDILPRNQYRIYVKVNDEPIVSLKDLDLLPPKFMFCTPMEFLRELLLFKLRKPLGDTLYSYAASRTNFEPYQFKPVIKFLSNASNRILIADEVGLGKTIEACIIYLELKARMQGDLKRALIVCPATLTKKWQDELKSRFNENFTILDKDDLEQFFNDFNNNGGMANIKGICSIERLRIDPIVQRITETQAEFDLVIVDEAHHMKNPDTLSYDLGEILSAHADAMVLLTATPVQLGSQDLFYLLKILEPAEFKDLNMFEYQLEPNRNTNKAISCLQANPPKFDDAYYSMCKNKGMMDDNPYFNTALSSVVSMVEKPALGQPGLIIDCIRNLQKTNTFSYLFNRTRRKEASSNSATRHAHVISVNLTSVEKEIYAKTLEFAAMRAAGSSKMIHNFGVIQVERQVASSIGAFKSIVEKYYTRNPESIDIEATSSDLNEIDKVTPDKFGGLVNELQDLYIQLNTVDSKFDRFFIELTKILNSDETRKVIIYSFFKGTLKYLLRRLNHNGLSASLISGDIPVFERQKIIDTFKEDSQKRVLLSSEVGSEGIDLQFCDTIINYDLPWNPMRVEQRIGRIDRYGQKSPKVTIVSFFMADTIEERILMRLYERIGVFKEAIGDLEPILGGIVQELQESAISQKLTKQEEEEKVNNFFKTLEFRKQDQNEFESHRYELIGQDKLFINQVSDNINDGRYVSSNEISALISSYFRDYCNKSTPKLINSEKQIWNLPISVELRDQLQKYRNATEENNFQEINEFIAKLNQILQPSETHIVTRAKELHLTYSNETSVQRPLLEFVNLWHPLTRLAASKYKNSYSESNKVIGFTASIDNQNFCGEYYFCIFNVSTLAVYPIEEIITLVFDLNGKVNEEISKSFLRVIQDQLHQNVHESGISFTEDELDNFMKIAFAEMVEIKEQKEKFAKEHNEAFINARKVALEKTCAAKVERLQVRLSQATEPRIIRMQQGEIRNLKSKLELELDELGRRKVVSVTYEPVASGQVKFVYSTAAAT